jgi:UDP-N-acetyl-D-glucosamine dehydrogenase
MCSAIVRAASERGVELKLGEDLFVAFSPEREDPGRAGATTRRSRSSSAVSRAAAELASAFYRSFIESVHEVSSAEVAEAAKLLENIYRASTSRSSTS